MRNVLAVVFVLMLSFVAMAAPETQQLGPFTVSFDMNTNIDHTIETAQPMENEFGVSYQMRIFTDNSTYAIIGVSESKSLADATISTGKTITALRMAPVMNITNIEDKTIDGKNGFIIIATPFTSEGTPSDMKVYQAGYWLDSKECPGCGDLAAGTTNVGISSSYPEDVTMSLLDTIKIKKTG